VALSHVTWATGARLPVEQVVELAHSRGAVVAVDGAQSVGAIPVAVEEIGADFYSVPGQKWLLGPEGTGAGTARRLSAGPPDLAGYFSFESMNLAGGQALGRREFQAAGFHQPRSWACPQHGLAVDVRRLVLDHGGRPLAGEPCDASRIRVWK
jgi:L-cysteine/cystine lyase